MGGTSIQEETQTSMLQSEANVHIFLQSSQLLNFPYTFHNEPE
jgi:hypothetical protein